MQNLHLSFLSISLLRNKTEMLATPAKVNAAPQPTTPT